MLLDQFSSILILVSFRFGGSNPFFLTDVDELCSEFHEVLRIIKFQLLTSGVYIFRVNTYFPFFREITFFGEETFVDIFPCPYFDRIPYVEPSSRTEVQPHIVRIALDPHGTRAVQKLLEVLKLPEHMKMVTALFRVVLVAESH